MAAKRIKNGDCSGCPLMSEIKIKNKKPATSCYLSLSLSVGPLKLPVPLAHFRQPAGRVCVSRFSVFDFVVVVGVFLPFIV